MTALYNELDAYPAQWLRNLIAAGHVAPGVVDERSIVDLSPDDVAGPGQRHFFAGIGVWSAALRDAGVPDDASIWTASCPCQPFSGAGKRRGTDDERHLWPVLRGLVEECRPPILLGEQVASRDGRAWFAAVRADLEALGYAVGAADLCAAGVGAPHIRQRIYFVAYAEEGRRRTGWSGEAGDDARQPGGPRAPRGLVDAGGARGGRHAGADARAEAASSGARGIDRGEGDGAVAASTDGQMGDSDPSRREERRPVLEGELIAHGRGDDGFWSACDWIPCSDGKSRPVEPGTFPLAHGVVGRVGRLRAYGNAIVRQQAAAFIRAALEVTP